MNEKTQEIYIKFGVWEIIKISFISSLIFAIIMLMLLVVFGWLASDYLKEANLIKLLFHF